jgi:uncharacterized protein (DUF924 family)
MSKRIDAVLEYWFHDPRNGAPDLAALNRFWFGKSDAVDAYIRRCFNAELPPGRAVELELEIAGDRRMTVSGVVETAEERDASTVLDVRLTGPAPGVTPARHDPPAVVLAMDAARARISIESDFRLAARGRRTDWIASARGALAVVILLDQFSRNMFRGTPRAFAQDPLALASCRQAIERGMDEELSLIERTFLYMPMEHSEDLAVQDQGVHHFGVLLDRAPAANRELFAEFKHYADAHHRIIERFGRFPHRNAALGRRSTPEELRFLEEPGSSF